MPARRTAAVLVNRGSAGAPDDEAAAARVRRSLGAHGIDAEVALVDGPELAMRASKIVATDADLLIVAGGDGSVGAAAGALAGGDTALGVIPLGTLNHFARDLGIPLDIDRAAALIAEGRTRRIDVAEANGRTFVNNSAIGLYPLMVLDRQSQQQRLLRSKRLAKAVAAARTLARFRKLQLILTADVGEARIETPLLFVGNNSYSLELPNVGSRERLDAGELCVIVMRRRSRLGFLAASLRALVGRARATDVIRMTSLERLRVDSALGLLNVSLDGESIRLEPPIRYEIRKRALKVIAP